MACRAPTAPARALALGAVCLLTALALTVAQAAPAAGWNQSSAEATLWQLTNGARVNNGLSPLQQNGTLVALARWRSGDMLQRNYFSHDIAGSGCQVYCYFDSNGLFYVFGGENIGWNNGYSDADSPVAVHEGFMNSPSHRENILNPLWTHGGVGAAASDGILFLDKLRSPRMYTELFMQAAGAPAPPSAGGRPTTPRTPEAPRQAPGGNSSSEPVAAPVAPATPTPARMQMDQPVAPVSGAPLDGATIVVRAPRQTHGAGHFLESADLPPQPAITAPGSSLRVEAAPVAETGWLETLFSALFGWR